MKFEEDLKVIQFNIKSIEKFGKKVFGQMTKLSKGQDIITYETDRVDSRVLPEWSELKH